jgi:hypothetical protein
MPTRIEMDKLSESKWNPISVTPSEFAKYRSDSSYRIRDNDPLKAFIEFKDFGPRGASAFVEDCIYAIKNKNQGPSWEQFIKCLTEASLFSIITARGHEYDTIKNGVKYVIDNCLTSEQKDLMYANCLVYSSLFETNKNYTRNNGKFTDNELIKVYLDCCKYYGVGAPYSESFAKEFKLKKDVPIEECKKIVLGRFIDICNEYGSNASLGVSIGFSDDDKKNVEAIKKYFEEKSNEHINLKFNVFDTSSSKINRTKYIKGIKEDMGSNLANNQANLLRFDSFNSQSRTLQNSTNDFTGYNNQQMTKVATNLYKKNFKKKLRKAKNKKDKKETV